MDFQASVIEPYVTRVAELSVTSLIGAIKHAADKRPFAHLVSLYATEGNYSVRHAVFKTSSKGAPLFPALQLLRWQADELKPEEALKVLYVRKLCSLSLSLFVSMGTYGSVLT